MSLKRVPQPLHFEAGAKQREQASDENYAAPCHQEKIDTRVQLGKMSEHGDAEQGAAEDETEFAQKQKTGVGGMHSDERSASE